MCAILGYCGKRASYETMKRALEKTATRGPDDSRILNTGSGFLGFNRLAIMDLSDAGMQPFTRNGNAVVCNGEIYDFRELKELLEQDGYTFTSGSDCELLLPLWEKYGVHMFRMLDAEFAMILYDKASDSYIAARDPIGIRPLYYGKDAEGTLLFASEPKNLVGLCDKITPFPPGHYYRDGKFICYRNMSAISYTTGGNLDSVCEAIHDKLVDGVRKRLDSDAPVGFLLSGGLDSSLVCGIAAKLMPGK
ncbi:MAG: asparagine synthetase B, partial [Clostridium sp.]|nr:asparagine synthetase B [Clostridium sp.]